MRDGYPDNFELDLITVWNYKDFKGLMDYVKDIWKYSDCGCWNQEGDTYNISTGGWSGNEDIIGALMENRMFWRCCWESSRRGGHYVFKVKQQ